MYGIRLISIWVIESQLQLFRFKHFANSRREQLRRSIFLVKLPVSNLQLYHWCFDVNFTKFLICFRFQKQLVPDVLRNWCFIKILQNSEETPLLEYLFSKVMGLQPITLLKQRLGCLPLNFAKFPKTPLL